MSRVRLTRKMVQARFERVAAKIKWDIVDDETSHRRIGCVSLNHHHDYGGYAVEQITTSTGGVTRINGQRMNATGLMCWFDGILYAQEHLPIPLDTYALKQAEYHASSER